MLVSVGDVRLFVDVDGAKLVPHGMSMRERPTIILLHGGPGFDHTPHKELYAPLTEIAQLVYYDHRGNGRSESGPRERWTLDQWADDLRKLCDVLGIDRADVEADRPIHEPGRGAGEREHLGEGGRAENDEERHHGHTQREPDIGG